MRVKFQVVNMKIFDIITKKKEGRELSRDEIFYFVRGYTEGKIPDYQISALLMAICIRGMSESETNFLTEAIRGSGDTVDLSEFGKLSADKHSTGGVGDKTTLIVAPLAATLGCKVAKMSGRGLGHTGGTVDKLESIPGYKVSLTPEEFREQVHKVGVAVISQSGNLTPADKKLYALRDVTATIDSIPLISSSVMGKKLASGAASIVLDVKCGSGAFLKTPEEARALAECMVKIGKAYGRSTAALITDMDTPLGYAVGNSLEVKEALEVLRGRGPDDLTEISVSLAAAMAMDILGVTFDEARALAYEKIRSGEALRKFSEWILAQGATFDIAKDDSPLQAAHLTREVKIFSDGYISAMNAELIGRAAMTLGAGRATKDAQIDYSAGIMLRKKTGDRVADGDSVATLYTNKPETLDEAEEAVRSAITLSEAQLTRGALIHGMIN